VYHLYSKNNSKIVHHYCNTPELAQVVKDYIEGRHACEIIIEKIGGDYVYYDAPGIKFISKELYSVVVGKVETRIDDIGALIYVMKNKEVSFQKGFCRLKNFGGNLCLSEAEYKETLQYIEDNMEKLLEMDEEASDIILTGMKKCGTDGN
jgi:hypothetical protein